MPGPPSIPPVLDSEVALEQFVRAERVRFVFIQSLLPMLFSPMAAATLCVALWSSGDHARLISWACGTAVIAAFRVLLVRTYPKTPPTPDVVRKWERGFVASILVVDLWWGVGCLFLMPGHLAGQVLVFSFLMLMAGGHAASYAAHPITVLFGVLALVLPVTVELAVVGDAFHGAMAFASLMYLTATFRSIRTLGYFFAKSHRLAHDVQVERDRAEKLARTDFLTGLNNRRAFYEVGAASLRRGKRYGREASLVMLDVDHFKAINDRFGHAAGDAVIKGIADVIRGQIRSADIAGRLGGEEFAVLLPETGPEAGLVAAERIRQAASDARVEHDGHPLAFTVSLGVTGVQPDDEFDAIVARADAALYRAKHAGRNRVSGDAA